MYSLLQVFVSYRSSQQEVDNLKNCISELNKDIVRTAILVNIIVHGFRLIAEGCRLLFANRIILDMALLLIVL